MGLRACARKLGVSVATIRYHVSRWVPIREKDTRTPDERFWAKVAIAGPDECWEWRGARNQYGYGAFGGRERAHRHSYELSNGPVPTGLHVLHSCDNPPCVNPAHLRAGTPKDNSQDKKERGRMVIPVGEHNGKSKLTREAVIEIRNTSATSREMAEKFGVTTMTVQSIRAGHGWADCGKTDPVARQSVDRRKHKARGEAHPNAKLTWESVAELRQAFAGGASKKGLARRFGVTPGTISAAVSLRTWHTDRRPVGAPSLTVDLEDVPREGESTTITVLVLP